ncbi:MAG: hypothetical protein JF887_11465 [Candidatus Dormibacteraeota bacterium]|uniref:Uncharacterized protein n=1 Tax=Candidatus Amunia macphersoniae TaxID=3127014 RepID=A0A934KPU9_9BACT|nr:hypothetical protein [Candidatus Dormibacteraeota bacterium]
MCYFPYLDEEAWIGDTLSVEVCPSCGTQFDDAEASGPVSDREQRWVDLRDQWIIAGAPWHSTTDRPPRDWPPPAATLT